MEIEIIEKAELGSLISPQRNQHIPVHNWYTFKHGFSRDLALTIIADFNLTEGSWVLDPFCGGGTTLLTCKELGINSRGFDVLPFSVFLSNVKIADYDAAELARHLDQLTTDSNAYYVNTTLPDIPLVNKAFQSHVKNELLLIRHKIERILDPKIRSFFNLAFLAILEPVSNTSKSGGFLRIVERDVSAGAVQSLFFGKATSMINDVAEHNRSRKRKDASSVAKIGDARKLPTHRKYDAAITSPPYPNRHDYTRIYSLEMIFNFVSSNEELKRIRYETIRSHVEARKKYEAAGYKKPIILDALITEVRKNGTNNPQVIGMLEGYFEDMYLSLAEMQRSLKPKGKVGLVVSNVRFAGVNIIVDEILAEIGSQVGLTPKDIWAVRYRGNSSQQMRDYERKPSRESIIIWEKDGK
jgi:hypothetical protein